MGAIEVEPPATLADEHEAEKCVGEGGHFFVREQPCPPGWYMRCERCGAEGYENADEPVGARTGRIDVSKPNLSNPVLDYGTPIEKPGGFYGPGVTWTGPGGLDS